MRTFLHSTAGGLYVNVFHFAHLGKLTGLGSVCGAIFCLLNDPAFKMMNSIFNKDPFYVRISINSYLESIMGKAHLPKRPRISLKIDFRYSVFMKVVRVW